MVEKLNINWPPSPAVFSLGENDVHVWTASLQPAPATAAACEAMLSPDEKTRASRFFFERDSSRFVAARGTLRAILGRYLHLEPRTIKFIYSERGKPSLAKMAAREHIHFNLAHSCDLAVVAVSKIPNIGIDLEKLRPIKDAEGIAERFFSQREANLLKSLPPTQRQVGFFNLWTRKEAWLKATGEGIGELLNQVEVSLLPGEAARLLSISNDADTAAEWTLRELIPASGYLGALAVRATNFQVQCWHWQEQQLATIPFPPDMAASHPQSHERRI